MTKLLTELQNQQTNGSFTYSIVVADNDPGQSAKAAVIEFSKTSKIQAVYCHDAEPNIAKARNKALENATGEYVAFIDDDEFCAQDWLQNLLLACVKHEADGVLGPVKPSFENEPPQWVVKGKFFDRPTHETGYQIRWEEGRTGNVLFKRSILNADEPPFHVKFDTAGEDVDFFRRMIAKGYKFVWCDEAVAYELIPASRCNRKYLLRRALLRGSNFPKHPTDKLKNVLRSLIAVPIYTVALPVLVLFGQHVFLNYLIKLLDHASRLLAFAGLPLISERQT